MYIIIYTYGHKYACGPVANEIESWNLDENYERIDSPEN